MEASSNLSEVSRELRGGEPWVFSRDAVSLEISFSVPNMPASRSHFIIRSGHEMAIHQGEALGSPLESERALGAVSRVLGCQVSAAHRIDQGYSVEFSNGVTLEYFGDVPGAVLEVIKVEQSKQTIYSLYCHGYISKEVGL